MRQRLRSTCTSRPPISGGRGVALTLAALLALAAGAGCDLGRVTVGTTAAVLLRAQPAMKMESDYELAARAFPGTLKTIEGFWVVSPDDDNLLALLTEGYCQYGLGFVEDEWEAASLAGDLPRVAELDAHATKVFTRCLNYALRSLGASWQRDLTGTTEQLTARLAATGHGQRTPLLWAALALGSIIQHNLDNIDLVGQASSVKLMLGRVLELDATKPPSDRVLAALPHLGLGQLESASSQTGNADRARAHFERAIELTTIDGQERYLLPRAFLAYRIGRMKRDRALYHDNLVKVLTTAPSVWPQERLANEIAHRRARRYLTAEKELFR